MNVGSAIASRWPYIFNGNREEIFESLDNVLLSLVDNCHEKARAAAKFLAVTVWDVELDYVSDSCDSVDNSEIFLKEFLNFILTNEVSNVYIQVTKTYP